MFNALPIPPLDGSRVADALVPEALRLGWEAFCRLGPLSLVAVIAVPLVLGIDLFYWPLQATQFIVHQVLMLLCG